MKLKQRIIAVLTFCLFLVISLFLYFQAVQIEFQLHPLKGQKSITDNNDAIRKVTLTSKIIESRNANNISVAAYVGMQVNVKVQEMNFSALRDDHQRIMILRNLIAVMKQQSAKHDLEDSMDSVWAQARKWADGLQVHPEHTPGLGQVLKTMSVARIVQAGAARKGTQNKLAFLLEGGQKAIFKPMKYSRDIVIEGLPYAGWDRHNGEIAAFHLNRILNFRLTPLTVGRVVDLDEDVKPVASEILLKTFFKKDGNTCFYGVCYYCSRQDPVCGKKNKLEGALILWLPDEVTLKRHPNPWRRNYRVTAPARWEKEHNFCQRVLELPYFREKTNLLSLIDSAVFDYLIGNADRHTVEAPSLPHNAPIMLLDNGKSFGNPYWDEFTILAPLYQCCRIRRSTYTRLKIFIDHLGSSLKDAMANDPLSPILTNPHLEAIDRRLRTVLATVHVCFDKFGQHRVLYNK